MSEITTKHWSDYMVENFCKKENENGGGEKNVDIDAIAAKVAERLSGVNIEQTPTTVEQTPMTVEQTPTTVEPKKES